MTKTVDEKVLAIFLECFGQKAASLAQAVDDQFQAAVAQAFPRMASDERYDLAFHLSDWRLDAAFILALHLEPQRFSPEEIRDGIQDFLIHAPNHVAAAAKLGGWPIEDIFELGVLDGVDDR